MKMNSSIKIILLIALVCFVATKEQGKKQDVELPAHSGFSSTSYKQTLPVTPKAADLYDHFGTNPKDGLYGPQTGVLRNVAREGVIGGAFITPIGNFNQEIQPHQVVSGDLTNTAFDSSRIVRPKIAGYLI